MFIITLSLYFRTGTIMSIPGVYDRVSAENFEEFLGKMGANFLMRKMAKSASPTLTITAEGETALDHSRQYAFNSLFSDLKTKFFNE